MEWKEEKKMGDRMEGGSQEKGKEVEGVVERGEREGTML